MRKMSVKLSAATFAMSGALAAFSAGFDGMSLATNDWFDANFTALTADTAIAADSTTGITLGAGSWTAVPSTGTATVVADADAGGGATMLSLDAPGEDLVFAPAVFSSPTDYETVSFVVKGDASDTPPAMGGDVQAAFTLVDDGTTVTATGYTADGWTNLVYSAGADTLTNAWFTMYMDFANVGGVRYVRFSVKPSGASAPVILADAESTAWFRTATSATAINAVSLSGVGSCRTFNGDSLAVIPVAEVNGVSYGSLNDAIAAANAGDTVTLVRNTFDNEAIAATKSVTVALGAYNLTAESFSVSSGSTLTFTGTGSVTAPAITGGGSLVFSNDATLNLTGGTSALAAITAAGDLTVAGCGDIALTGAATVAGTLTFTPDTAYTVHNSYGTFFANGYTLKLTADAVDAEELNGAAAIEADVTASAGTFYGTITGDITASGSLTLQGPQTVSGTLNVTSGTVTVESREPTGCDLRLDASDTSNMTISEGSLNSFTTKYGNGTRTWNSNGTAYATVGTDENYFGGRQVMMFNANAEYNYSGGNLRYGALFAVYQTNIGSLSEDNENVLFTSKSNEGSDKVRFGIYKSGYQNRSKWYGWNNSSSQASNYSWPIFLDGSNSSTSYTSGKRSVLSFASSHPGPNSRGIQIGCAGATFVGAVAEIIGMNNPISLEERAAIESYLMQKWNCDDKASFAQFASTAEVALSNSAVLDLGGLAQTIKSLSGSGTVQNGTLTVTDPISVSVGQTLVIPYGSTYTCASGTGANIDTTAGTVTFVHNAADIDGVAYDTVQGAILAYESGTLTIHENATDIDLGTTEVNISGIVLADGISAPTFSTTLPWQTTYSEGSLTHTRVVSTFVYVGPAAYAVAASNFEIGGVVASDVPGTGDTVQFDSDVTISTSGASYRYGTVVVNADVTLNGGNNSYYLHADSISGTGKIALGNYAKIATQSGAGTISCEVEVNAASASNAAQLYVAASGREITLTGVLSGSGYLKCTRAKNASDYSGCTFHCSDTAGFTGTIEMVRPDDNVGRNIITFWPTCDLSGATVIKGVHQNNSGNGRGRFIDGQSNDTVYKFGSLNGYVWPAATSVSNSHPTIEIGALNRDDAVTGNWMPNTSRNPYIRKVGTGTLTTTAANAYGYILNGGTLKVLATDTAPVTTEVSGKKVVRSNETIDAVEYTVYTLGNKPGSMVLIF